MGFPPVTPLPFTPIAAHFPPTHPAPRAPHIPSLIHSPAPRRARGAVAAYTRQALRDLQADDDEMLRGVDWAQARFCLMRARVLG
jgi:hypothetical protein